MRKIEEIFFMNPFAWSIIIIVGFITIGSLYEGLYDMLLIESIIIISAIVRIKFTREC